MEDGGGKDVSRVNFYPDSQVEARQRKAPLCGAVVPRNHKLFDVLAIAGHVWGAL